MKRHALITGYCKKAAPKINTLEKHLHQGDRRRYRKISVPYKVMQNNLDIIKRIGT